jgi:uncharacterized protein (DUF362 family)
VNRRSFVQLLAAEAAIPFTARLASGAGPYRVGVGGSADGYTATTRALAASGEWPQVSGRTVVIKPNLVTTWPSTTGVTTDPQVVRAVVDQALASGAAKILIVEGGPGGPPAHFTECGYDFFNTYNPKVQLVDLGGQPAALVPVSKGFAYKLLYMTAVVTQPGTVLVSVGKLKTHHNSFVSLSMKNLVALAVPNAYSIPNLLPRMDMHFRGIDQAVADLSLARPIDFAVIDGIWGMEGNGPALGTPVQVNVVLAGKNSVAVDRTGVNTMQLPQTSVAHLAYATVRGLGPADMSSVQLVGDPIATVPFQPAPGPPLVWPPSPVPASFSAASGQQTTIYYQSPAPCFVRLEIVLLNDIKPSITYVRTLRDWTAVPAGIGSVVWDGRDENGNLVPHGTYTARIEGRVTATTSDTSFATNWVGVSP